MGMVKVPLYERKGDADGSYMGSRYKHWLRYQFRYSDKVKWVSLVRKMLANPS